MARDESDPTTFLITGADDDLEAVYRARKRRYLIMMSIRVPALIIAAIVYSMTQNGWIALAIIVASIPIPWIAVLRANDREPRKRGEVPTYHYGGGYTVGQAELAAEPARDRFADDDHPVIDAEIEAPDQPGDTPNDNRAGGQDSAR
ncbi:Protein of unknown function [Gordonia malaquae]|uniref:DUF3099 domain-containing protein n=1 Tax=Gordonia malaquae NBRC 108250 TaxID=1223542 RepID=M3TFS5_GORML|nr:DUF3099 domain-containing protein [Gordonia malaquae]GAC80286.1 hypothetical protein GM1_016_00470 [Gordonia malaquae NBRC 108250]SEC56323.1 Protein of unknown function [Gordonia malaquae]